MSAPSGAAHGAFHRAPPPVSTGGGGKGVGRDAPLYPSSGAPGAPAETGASDLITDGIDKGLAPLTKRVKFTDNKVIKIAFVIFLICAITMGAAALIVEYPVISSGFFSVLTVAGSAALLIMAGQGINLWKQKRAQAKEDLKAPEWEKKV